MGGALGILNYYLFPMLGLGLLALGAWCTWGLWRPQGPPVAARAAALVLGLVLGWILANLPHPEDALHMLLGWPLPVMTLVRASGLWLVMDARPSIPCLLLDLVVGIGSANALLRLFWRLRPRRRVGGRGPSWTAGGLPSRWIRPGRGSRACRCRAGRGGGAWVPPGGPLATGRPFIQGFAPPVTLPEPPWCLRRQSWSAEWHVRSLALEGVVVGDQQELVEARCLGRGQNGVGPAGPGCRRPRRRWARRRCRSAVR